MRSSVLAAFALLFAWTALAVAQNPKEPSFYTSHSSRTDQPKRPGQESDAEVWAGLAESLTHEYLLDLLPCVDVMSEDGANAILGVERMRQLLGSSGGEEGIAAVAGALGANYLINTNVVQFGENLGVTITVLNSSSGKVITRVVDNFPNDGEVFDRLEGMAVDIAAELADPLRCPAWQGTVTYEEEFHEISEKNGYPYEYHRVVEGSCTTDQWEGPEAQCEGRFTLTIKESSVKGVDFSQSDQGAEEGVPGRVVVTVEDGTINIFMDDFTIEGEHGWAVTVWGFSAEKPLGDDPTTTSGTEIRAVDPPEGQNVTNVTTISWNLAIR